MASKTKTLDGNEAAACVAYRLSEVAVIYPITPSSPMADVCDEWSAKGLKNIWGNIVSVMEMHDLACISHAGTLETRIPFLHFFDGFRTSHELSKIIPLADEDLRFMISEDFIKNHRERGLTPDRPVIRGTAQNPDTFFQNREACNPFYLACPEIVQKTMDRFAERTGRPYRPFDSPGKPVIGKVETIEFKASWQLAC